MQVKHVSSVAQASTSLVNSVKGEAREQSDSDMQNRLLGAAQALADATFRMVEAAKVCPSFLVISKLSIFYLDLFATCQAGNKFLVIDLYFRAAQVILMTLGSNSL